MNKKLDTQNILAIGLGGQLKKTAYNIIEPPYIDKKELDKILEPFIAIGNINPIPKDELDIYLTSATPATDIR